MTHRYRSTLALCCGLLSLCTSVARTAEFTTARVAVYFSPNGGTTEAVIREGTAATPQMLGQASSSTTVLIATVLMEAHMRRRNILAVPGQSHATDTTSAVTCEEQL
jgi:hypothetical protein